MKQIVQVTEVRKTLRRLGYKTTAPNHENANGPDLYAHNKHRSLRVEIKLARIASPGRKVLRIEPVEKSRREDDLIAIVHPTGYVLIENMKDHLLNCNRSGQRFINF